MELGHFSIIKVIPFLSIFINLAISQFISNHITQSPSILAELEDGPNVCQRSERQYFPFYTMKTKTYTEQVKPSCDFIDKIFSVVTKKCDTKTKLVERKENVTEYEERLVVKRYCCDGYIRFLGKCLPHCPDHCIHGECIAPDVCKCNPGFSGKRCLYSCKGLTWGPNCTHKCACQHTETCDAETGDCVCPAGWTGSLCSEPCVPGLYGPNCSLPCPSSCPSATDPCDRFTGSCAAAPFDCATSCAGDHVIGCNATAHACACSPGWTGELCDRPCPPGTYGLGCASGCGLCHTLTTSTSEGLCHHVSGDCACAPGRTGRLCEFGCPAGTFGVNCSQTCDCHNLALPEDDEPVFQFSKPQIKTTSDSSSSGVSKAGAILEYFPTEGDNTCEPVLGKCLCGSGYSGSRCEIRVCPSGTSMIPDTKVCGRNCSSLCDTSSDRVSDCHPITGACQCSAGWRTAPACAVPCPLSILDPVPERRAVLRTRFGFTCGSSCSCSRSGLDSLLRGGSFVSDTSVERLLVLECHPVTGHCICPPGTFGDECEKACPNGTYGLGCQHSCQCKNQEFAYTNSCNPISGSCLPCASGYYGLRCNSPCPEGFWGDGCMQKCPCQNGGSCDHKSGKCICPPGYTGQTCEAPCPAGTYGHGCVYACPKPSPCPVQYFYDNTSCDPVHGGCACRPGFITKSTYQSLSPSGELKRAEDASVCVRECKSCPPEQTCHPILGCAYLVGGSYANVLRLTDDTTSSKRSWLSFVIPPLCLVAVIALVGAVFVRRRHALRSKAGGTTTPDRKWHELKTRNNSTAAGPINPSTIPRIYGEEPEALDYTQYPTDPHDIRPIHGLPRRPLNPPKPVIGFRALNNTTSSPPSHNGTEPGVSRDGNFENPAYDDETSTYSTIPTTISSPAPSTIKDGRPKISNIEVANQLRRKHGSGETGQIPPPLPDKPNKDPNLLDLEENEISKISDTNTAVGTSESYNGPGTSDDPFYLAFMSKKDRKRSGKNNIKSNPLDKKYFGTMDDQSADSDDEINRAKEAAAIKLNEIEDDFLKPSPSDKK